jgi:hypothetical protein
VGELTALAEVAVMFDQISAVFFLVVVGVTLAVAGLILLQAWLYRDPLRGSLVVILVGLAVALLYESYSLWTGTPTISRIAAQQFQAHPGQWLGALFAAMLVLGGVVLDFVYRSRRRWLVLAAGAVASVGGGLVAHITGWLP